MSPPKKNRLLALLTFMVAFVVYWQTLSAGFLHWDDDIYVFANPIVMAGLTWEGFARSLSAPWVYNWHPLTMLSLMLDAELYGRDPFGFHLTNVVLHAANSVLVFYFVLRLLGSLGGASTVAILFALHPQHVESVAWISERKGLLSASAWLVALMTWQAFITSRTSSNPSGLRRFFWISVALHGVSLLAKPSAVALPLTLFLLDWWYAQNRGIEDLRSKLIWIVLEKWPFVLLSAVFSIVTIHAQELVTEPVGVLPWNEHALRVTRNYGWYLWKSLVPYPLSPFYVTPTTGYLTISSAAYSLLFVGTIALAWRIRRILPGLLFGASWLLLTLLPMIGLVKVGHTPTADRYAYVPHIGLFTGLVCCGLYVARRWPQMRLVLMMLAVTSCLICAGLTIRQVPVWSNSKSLWTWVVEHEDPDYIPFRNLAQYYIEALDFEKAVEFSKKALELKPTEPSPHMIIALSLIALGDLAGAEQKVPILRSIPEWANSVTGGIAEARGDFLTAVIAWAPPTRTSEALAWDDHIKLASAYFGIGATEKSKEHLQKAAEVQPRWRHLMFMRSWSRLLDPVDASKKESFLLLQAKRFGRVSDVNDPQSLQLQAAAMANAGYFPEAVRMMDRAVKLIENDSVLWSELRPAFLEQREAYSAGKRLYTLARTHAER